MTREIPRTPYHHAVHAINETSEQTNKVTSRGGMDSTALAGVLTARSNLAVAAALLAIADAIRATTSQPDEGAAR